jgi:hypothetical protein
MVTPKFMGECAKKFIIKHLRAIRTCMNNIKITKQPGVYFSSITPMLEHLDALIKIEPYYEMSRPTPSTFKKEFLQNKPLYTANMIKRYIHEVKQHIPAPGTFSSIIVRKYFQAAFNDLMSFSDQMEKEDMNLVDVFYSGLFKRNYKDPIPPADEDTTEYDDIIEIPETANEEKAGLGEI